MARRGRFGRRRVGSTNLTALITQLVREQRAAEDRVMFDAYQNGGLVDGKPVTDKRILDYIKGRRDGFSTDDPLYDEWNNRFIQYDFSIGESKIQLAFQQGKVGAGAVARFYRSQMGKLPKDSAFYREVAGRAAQWAKAAGSAARGRARASASAGTRDKLNKLIYKSAEYDAFEAALTEYARREGIITGNERLVDADAGALRAMFDRGIYSGDDRITFDDWKTAASDQYKNLSGQVDLQVKLGNQGTEYRARRDKFLSSTLLGLNTVDEREQYELSRAALDDDLAAAGVTGEPGVGDPYAIAEAYERHLARLQGIQRNALAETGEARNDPLFVGAVENEINGIVTGQPQGQSVLEMYGEAGDLAQQVASAKSAQDDIALVTSGKAYLGQNEPGGPLGVRRFEAGVGTNPLALDKSLQPSISTINGKPRVVYLKGQPVVASLVTDSANVPLDPRSLSAEQVQAGLASGAMKIAEGGTVGYVFVNPNGSRKYGIFDPGTGNLVFTDENPWTNEPINNGENLLVFTEETTRRRDNQGDWTEVPDPEGVRIAGWPGGTPFLSDSTIAPDDLARLLDSGIPGVNVSAEALAKYKGELQQKAYRQQAITKNRDLGIADRMGIGGQLSRGTTGGGGDLRSSILDGMGNIKQVTQELFGSPDRSKDDLYVPPSPKPPTAPPAPTPGSAPPPQPSYTPPKIKKQTKLPSGTEITEFDDGSRSAGGSWADPKPDPYAGKKKPSATI